MWVRWKSLFYCFNFLRKAPKPFWNPKWLLTGGEGRQKLNSTYTGLLWMRYFLKFVHDFLFQCCHVFLWSVESWLWASTQMTTSRKCCLRNVLTKCTNVSTQLTDLLLCFWWTLIPSNIWGLWVLQTNVGNMQTTWKNKSFTLLKTFKKSKLKI